jgi:hypothetical protein
LDWMDIHHDASKDDLGDHRKDVEQIWIPLMRQAYSGNVDDQDDEYFDSDI